MKKINLLKTVSMAAIALALSFLVIGCNDDDDDDFDTRTYSLSGSASGSQEVPAVTTSATAVLTGTYYADSNKLNYNIVWNGLSGLATGIHFHGPALAGANADVIHPISITSNGVNGTSSGTLTIADSTENHLLNGRIYYNLHTTLNTNGEIRGQVTATEQ